jgi:hypothetical protein
MRQRRHERETLHDQQSSAKQKAGSLYTDEFIGDLARSFDIKPEQLEPLKRFLNDAAQMYEATKGVDSLDEQLLIIRDGLRRVAAAHNELTQLLRTLSFLPRDRLWHPMWEKQFRPPGKVFFSVPFEPNEYPDENSFRDALEALGRRIQARLNDLRDVNDRGGRPKGLPLTVWAAQVRDFWEQVLGRKFVYKRVFHFLTMAIHPLAPDVTDAALRTAVREIRKPLKVTLRISPELLAPKSLQKPPQSKR